MRLNHTAARVYIAGLALSSSLVGFPTSVAAAEHAKAGSTATSPARANVRIENFGKVDDH